jgi:hypothetical protein
MFEQIFKRIDDVYRGKLASLAEMKQSLLQKAYAGELAAEAAEEAVA